MLALLSPRLWIALAFAGLLAFTHHKAFQGGKAAVQVLWTAEKLADSEAKRQREKALTITNQGIDRAIQADKKRRADSERRTADSLRDFKAAITERDIAPTPSGANGRGGLERELLGQCGTALAELAITADKLEATVVGLQGYVQNVCMSQ